MKEQLEIVCKRYIRRRGQYTALFAILLLPMLLFTGMGLDFGMYYVDEARLVRSVDGAALRIGTNYTSDIERQKAIIGAMMKANYPGWGDTIWNSELTASGFYEGISTGTSKDKDGTPQAIGVVRFSTSSTPLTGSATFEHPSVAGFDGEDNMGSAKGGIDFDTTMSSALYEGYEWDENVGEDYGKSAAVDIEIEAVVRHKTFFLPLVGLTEADMVHSATVTRNPKVIMLVLDNSRSMTNTIFSGEGDRIRKDEALAKSVTDFLNFFDNDQDYFGVVYFAGKGKVAFPKGGPFVPRQDFKKEIIDMLKPKDTQSTQSIREDWDIETDYILGPHTNGQEGFRLAYNMVENFLTGLPDARDKVDIHYIIFSDGEFNAMRTFVRGSGYNNLHDEDNDPMSVPWTHHIKPLTYSKDIGGTIGTFNRLDPYSGKLNGSFDLDTLVGNIDTTSIPGVNANLCTFVASSMLDVIHRSPADNKEYIASPSYNADPADGITVANSIITANSLSVPVESRNDDFWAPWGWVDEMLPATAPNNLRTTSPIPVVMTTFTDSSFDGKAAYLENTYVAGTIPALGTDYKYSALRIDSNGEELSGQPDEKFLVSPKLMAAIVENEINRMEEDIMVAFPGRIRTPRQNWTTDATTRVRRMPLYRKGWHEDWKNVSEAYYYYRQSSLSADIRWTSNIVGSAQDIEPLELQHEPGVITAHNSYIRYSGLRTSDKPDNNLRIWCWSDDDSEISGYNHKYDRDRTTDSWFYVETASDHPHRSHRGFRLQEIYPKFTFGGELYESELGVPQKFYKWSSPGNDQNNKWVNVEKNNIRNEMTWIMEAQAWLARKNHDANIYTVILNSNTSREHFAMANVRSDYIFVEDPSSRGGVNIAKAPLDTSQPSGFSADASTSNDLSAAFDLIAQDIIATFTK
ncbi:MAG: pilus assembly protein TadG-related protein [Verrucomicrobiota bacterium]